MHVFNHVMSEVCFKLRRDVPGEDLDDTIFPTIRALWLPWDSSCLCSLGGLLVLTFSKMKSFVKLTRIHLDDLKLVSEGVLSKKSKYLFNFKTVHVGSHTKEPEAGGSR